MQRRPPTGLDGVAVARGELAVLRSQHLLRRPPLRQEEDGEVVLGPSNALNLCPFLFFFLYFIIELPAVVTRNIISLILFRYGPIFKTSLVGRPVIVSTDADLNYFIFQKEGELFQSWYPDTFTEIFGRQNVGSLHGFMYKYLKSMVLNLFGHESLKKMLPEVENESNSSLRIWSCRSSIDVKDAAAQVTLRYFLTWKEFYFNHFE